MKVVSRHSSLVHTSRTIHVHVFTSVRFRELQRSCIIQQVISSTTMDVHCEKLQHFCRICGRTGRIFIPGHLPYHKTRCAKEIKKALGIDVGEEADSNVYPPFVCCICNCTLQRWYKLAKRKRNTVITLVPADFKEHDDDCEICKYIIPDKPDERQVFQESCVEIALRYNYHHLQDMEFIKVNPGAQKVNTRVKILGDSSVYLEVHGKSLNPETVSSLVKVTTAEEFVILMDVLKALSVCCGNEGFAYLCEKRRRSGPAIFYSSKGDITSFEEYGFHANTTSPVIRHAKCKYLTFGRQCDVCKVYRASLLSMQKKAMSSQPQLIDMLSSKCRNDLMTEEQLRVKLKSAVEENKRLKRTYDTLRSEFDYYRFTKMPRLAVIHSENDNDSEETTITNVI